MRRIVVLALVIAALVVGVLSYGQIFVSQTQSGTVVTVPGLSVGIDGTSRMRKINSGTVAGFDYAPIAATTKSCITAVAVAGAAPGDIAIITPQVAFDDDIVFSETIAGTDIVTQCVYNPTAGVIDPAPINFGWIWIDVTP